MNELQLVDTDFEDIRESSLVETELSRPTQTLCLLQSPPSQSRLDPKGDLCLEVGMHPMKSFIVCSKTLARTSAFWDKMLYGGFREGKAQCIADGKSEWVVKLPEDNPTPMELLLNITHGLFDGVPHYEDEISVRELYEISVIADKYDMTHVLRPWARGWLRAARSAAQLTGESLREQQCHEQLWITWVFGDHSGFEESAKKLLLEFDDRGIYENYLRCDGILEPPEIYDIIRKTRLDVVKAILEPFHNIIARLIRRDRSVCQDEGHSKNERMRGCLPIMLGMVIQSLHRRALWPIPKPEETQLSIQDLSNKLKNICDDNIRHNHDFEAQRSNLQEKIEGVLNSIPCLLDEDHDFYLYLQAKKSGV